MNSQQLMTEEFHRRFGVFIRSSPGLVDEATKELRIRLIREELGELEKAANDKNLVKIADALKGDPSVLRAKNGKILKAKNWRPPDLQPILERM